MDLIKRLFYEGEFNKALELIEQLPIEDKLRGRRSVVAKMFGDTARLATSVSILG